MYVTQGDGNRPVGWEQIPVEGLPEFTLDQSEVDKGQMVDFNFAVMEGAVGEIQGYQSRAGA